MRPWSTTSSVDTDFIQHWIISHWPDPFSTRGNAREGLDIFSPRLAERDNDGSRGLKPTDPRSKIRSDVAERRLNGQTDRCVKRRSATRAYHTRIRGLKSTATIMTSLCEAMHGNERQRFGHLRHGAAALQNLRPVRGAGTRPPAFSKSSVASSLPPARRGRGGGQFVTVR